MLYFNNKLFRGNRVIKMNSSRLDAFCSPNIPPLATVGTYIDGTLLYILNHTKPLATSTVIIFIILS